MMYIGVDTSNYTTSVAAYNQIALYQQRRLLPVAQGALGLRQSDAVFAHVKALGELATKLKENYNDKITAIGVSAYPRNQQSSYMPCFLAGVMATEFASSIYNIPMYKFSHQAGHIAAALYGADKLQLAKEKFIALHVSGGTTECLLVNDLLHDDIQVLSKTNDLNAGQVIDRVGNMLGIAFPAGKELDRLACMSNKKYNIKPTFKGVNPCISGVENKAKQMLECGQTKQDVARYVIEYILSVVGKMADDAILSTQYNTVLFAGGVMSNSIISLDLGKRKEFIFSKPEFSTDNAVGIAILTQMLHQSIKNGEFDG